MEHAVAETGTINERSEGSVMLAAGVAVLMAVFGTPFLVGVAGMLDSGGPAESAEHGGEHGGADAHAAERDSSSRDYVRTVTGKTDAAATAAKEASDAALSVLEADGNAYDALIAASFVVSVVRPHSTGIGGGGFVVWRDAAGKSGSYDGREAAPARAHESVYLDSTGAPLGNSPSLLGARAAGVPGMVKLLHTLYREKGSYQNDPQNLRGKTDWATLVRYGIRYAERVESRGAGGTVVRGGFQVREQLAQELEAKASELSRFEATRRVFLPKRGTPPQVGETLYQEDLAQTLRLIAKDPDVFYTGEIAEEIERATGGWITRADLAAYEIRRPAPIQGTYRGYTVISMPPPSSGGVHLVQMLKILEAYPVGEYPWLGSQHLHLLAESMRRAYADRAEHMGGDVKQDVLDMLTSDQRIARLRGGIDPNRATLSDEIGPRRIVIEEGDHTTHLSIVDGQGNAVSSTQTINTSFGSKFVVGRTGILLNNEMDDFTTNPGKPNFFGLVQSPANNVKAGRRPLSSMTPTIVLSPDNKVVAVIGSPGGSRIITSVLQVIVNMIDFGKPIDEAVAAPRVHQQWMPDALWVDKGVDHEACRELAEKGHVVYYGQKTLGNVQALQVLPDGSKLATSDPRGTGEPAAR